MSEMGTGKEEQETVTITRRFTVDSAKYAAGQAKSQNLDKDGDVAADPLDEELDAEYAARVAEKAMRETRGVVLSPDGRTVMSVPCSIESFTFPDGVVRIARGAFSRCEKLKAITIPDTVKVIEPYAFSDCDKLETVQLPQSLEEFGFSVFEGCPKMEGRMILSGNRKELLCCERFEGEEIIIPSGVEEVNYDAFPYCPNAKTIVVPESTYKFFDNCFKGCRHVKTVKVMRKVDLTHAGLPGNVQMVVDSGRRTARVSPWGELLAWRWFAGESKVACIYSLGAAKKIRAINVNEVELTTDCGQFVIGKLKSGLDGHDWSRLGFMTVSLVGRRQGLRALYFDPVVSVSLAGFGFWGQMEGCKLIGPDEKIPVLPEAVAWKALPDILPKDAANRLIELCRRITWVGLGGLPRIPIVDYDEYKGPYVGRREVDRCKESRLLRLVLAARPETIESRDSLGDEQKYIQRRIAMFLAVRSRHYEFMKCNDFE